MNLIIEINLDDYPEDKRSAQRPFDDIWHSAKIAFGGPEKFSRNPLAIGDGGRVRMNSGQGDTIGFWTVRDNDVTQEDDE